MCFCHLSQLLSAHAIRLPEVEQHVPPPRQQQQTLNQSFYFMNLREKLIGFGKSQPFLKASDLWFATLIFCLLRALPYLAHKG